MRVYPAIKRTLDFVSATLLYIVTLPIQLVIAVLVAIKLGRPVLFKQDRPGRDGKVFTLIKFRSMKNIDASAGLVSDADRLTRFGKILRSTSLDELPTLWNVVRGDMSVVGPRPLLVDYLARYSPTQARRHDVRPGVTGLAQVRGRNNLSWDEKFAADVEYVDNYSFGMDAKILWQTFAVVFTRSGISSDNHATMPAFTGSTEGNAP